MLEIPIGSSKALQLFESLLCLSKSKSKVLVEMLGMQGVFR